MWDKPEFPLSQSFLDDMNQIASVEKLGAQITVPWLLIHGTEDDATRAMALSVLAWLPTVPTT
jgi:pimeloyl-ACP methyl ester carboxylesterase